MFWPSNYTIFILVYLKMNEAKTGIEREAISFFLSHTTSANTKTLKIEFTLLGSIFKTQLSTLKKGTPDEFLHFLQEFS